MGIPDIEIGNLRNRIAKLEAALRYIAEGEHVDEAPEIAKEALNEES